MIQAPGRLPRGLSSFRGPLRPYPERETVMIDHRKLGRELELFCSDPLAGAGLPIWLPAGAAARHAVEDHIRERERRAGYRHVVSPPLGRRELFELSGHAEHFGDDMFPPMRMSADDELVLRPSLCPHHALVFRSRGRSYRELPLRIAETGRHVPGRTLRRAGRAEPGPGHLAQRRAHLLRARTRWSTRSAASWSLIRQAHADLGVRASGFRLSLRGEGDKYVDDPAMWERASAVLRDGAGRGPASRIDEAPGEAAFYGPKIDIQVRDDAGREQTLSTVQVDYDKPARFGLSYVAADGSRQVPVMIHRSMVGSMERLFAHLIEVHAGAFPAWYAPVQLEVLPVSADQEEAAYALQRAGDRGGSAGGGVGGGIAGVADPAERAAQGAVRGDDRRARGRVRRRSRCGCATAGQLPPMPAAEALHLIGEVVAARSHDLVA